MAHELEELLGVEVDLWDAGEAAGEKVGRVKPSKVAEQTHRADRDKLD